MNKQAKVSNRTAAPFPKRMLVLAGALLAAAAGAWLVLAESPPARAETVVVKLSPLCSCCGGWVDHMRRAGYEVSVVEIEDVVAVKQAAGVPEELYSCHTAEIAGYMVEGHVPASAIEKLLRERPVIDGIALAGMPAGSPGMGGPAQFSYPVEAFRDGRPEGRFMDALLN
jgi:hypothetical protein